MPQRHIYSDFYTPPDFDTGLPVPLTGVATIPDEADRTIREEGEGALSLAQMIACHRAIWRQATPELRRRKLAKRAGVDITQFFGPEPDEED